MAKRSEVAMRQANAATAFIEGKMQEFFGYLELGNVEGIERVRVEMHALVDVRLDALQSAHKEIQREMEVAKRAG